MQQLGHDQHGDGDPPVSVSVGACSFPLLGRARSLENIRDTSKGQQKWCLAFHWALSHSPFQVRRKAAPAKEALQTFVRRWKDDPKVAGHPSHVAMIGALS
jgi:hypothetical protein